MAGLKSVDDVMDDNVPQPVDVNTTNDTVSEEPSFIDNTPLGNTEIDDISMLRILNDRRQLFCLISTIKF